MTHETPQQPPENEPSVLDLYKSVTKDWGSFFNFVQSLWDARRRAELDHALALEVAQAVARTTSRRTRPRGLFPLALCAGAFPCACRAGFAGAAQSSGEYFPGVVHPCGRDLPLGVSQK